MLGPHVSNNGDNLSPIILLHYVGLRRLRLEPAEGRAGYKWLIDMVNYYLESGNPAKVDTTADTTLDSAVDSKRV